MKNSTLNCDEIIELIKYKIEMTWAMYGRDVSQCKQNIFVCDLLSDCDVGEIKYKYDENEIGAGFDCISLSEKILHLWIEKEGLENVLTADLINLILKYYKHAACTSIDRIFIRMHQLCVTHAKPIEP